MPPYSLVYQRNVHSRRTFTNSSLLSFSRIGKLSGKGEAGSQRSVQSMRCANGARISRIITFWIGLGVDAPDIRTLSSWPAHERHLGYKINDVLNAGLNVARALRNSP